MRTNSHHEDQVETERQTSEAEQTGLRNDEGFFVTDSRPWEEKEMMYQDRIEELERRQQLMKQDFEERLERLEADLAQKTEALAAYELVPQAQQDGTVAEASQPKKDIQQLAAPALPVKILASVAGFLAGDNDYVTLSVLSSTSRLMSSVLSSTLYETVLWNEALNTRMELAQTNGVYPPKWRCIRFIVVDQHFWRYEANSVDTAFPNLRACIVKRKHFPYQRSNGEGSPPQYTVILEIIKDTTLTCLSSILRHPLRWFLAGEPYRYNVALGVSSVNLASTATFSIGSCSRCPSGILFESTQNEINRLSVRFQSDVGNPARSGEQKEDCLQVCSYLVLPTDSVAVGGRSFELRIECERTTTLEACIRQLPRLVERNKDIWLSIILSVSDEISREEFLGYIERFAGVYQILCRDAITDIDPDGPVMSRPLLQFGVKAPATVGGYQYRGQFMRFREQRGFKGKIEELRNGSMAVYQEKHYLPLES